MFKRMWSYDEWITCWTGGEETRGTIHDNLSMWLSYRWQYTGRDKLNRIIHSLLHHLSVVAPLHYFFKWQTNLSLANFKSAFELADWRGSNPGDSQHRKFPFLLTTDGELFLVWVYWASFLVKVSRIECQVTEILCQFSQFARSIACSQTIYFLFRYHRAHEWKSGITAGALSRASARGWGCEMRASCSQNWTKNLKKPLSTGYEIESI